MSKQPPLLEDDDREEPTPADLPARTPNSADRVSLGTIESALSSIAENLGQLRRHWDKAEDVERRALAARVAREFRSLGDDSHTLAAWLEELARTGA